MSMTPAQAINWVFAIIDDMPAHKEVSQKKAFHIEAEAVRRVLVDAIAEPAPDGLGELLEDGPPPPAKPKRKSR